MFETYSPSGRFSPSAFLILGIGVVAAVALSFVYQLLLEWIPFIYVNLLMTVGLGMAIGKIGDFFVRSGKVRNVAFAILAGLVMGVVCMGAKYVFQYQNFARVQTEFFLDDANVPPEQREELRKQIAAEITFLRHMQFRVESGWEIGGGGMPIKGVFVYLIWMIEAGMVLFFAVRMPVAAANVPFNETHLLWADEEEVVMTLPVTDQEMIKQVKTATSVDELLEIPIPKTDESNQFAVYTVSSIPGQEMEDAYLSVDLLTISINGKGEQETQTESLVKNAILSMKNRQQLVENASLLQEAMADFREAMEAEALADAEADAEGDAGSNDSETNPPQ